MTLSVLVVCCRYHTADGHYFRYCLYVAEGLAAAAVLEAAAELAPAEGLTAAVTPGSVPDTADVLPCVSGSGVGVIETDAASSGIVVAFTGAVSV